MHIHSFLLKPGCFLSSFRLSRYFTPCFLGVLFFALSMKMGALKAQPTSLPPFHAARPLRLDMQHIDLDIRLDWDKKRVQGTATLQFTLLTETNQVALDAGMLTIQRIALEKGAKLAYEYDGSDRDEALHLSLDRKYAAGERVSVQIDYHSNFVNEADPNNIWGSFGKGVRFFEPTFSEPRKRRQAWSMGEPTGNRYWFPSYDAPNDVRTISIRATVDTPMQFLSNGKLLGGQTNPDGTRTFHWKTDQPHANHQTAFVAGEYQDFKQKWDNLDLHSYSYPDELEATQATVVRLPEMVRFFSEQTGVKYPYPAYSQVFVQDLPWGGGGHAGFSTISENMVDDFGTHADFFYLWDGVEAQDLASQWFGQLLTPKDWADAWLSRSFALYFDCLFTEYKNGHDEMLLWNRQFQHSSYLADWNSGIRRPLVTRNYDRAETMTQDNYALRGAMVLHMLRKQLGEQNWQKAIQLYLKTFANQLVTTENFQWAVETSAGQDMDWFFDQWVYKMGHPVFEISRQYNPHKKQLTLNVLQTQKMDPDNGYPQSNFFQGMVYVEIDGRIEQVWLEAKAKNVFVFAARKAPKLLNFDFESTWIKELKMERSLDELLHQFEHDRDILGRRAAMLELSAIFKSDTLTVADQKEIQQAFRKIILGKSYWRLRYSALLTLQGMLYSKPLDETTISMLLTVIQREKSWNRAAAIGFLGNTRDARYTDLYLGYLMDESDRVVNAAAVALGKTKSSKAYDALLKLKDKPSWKNQSLISALNGLKELADPRGSELALAALKDLDAAPRWTLATSTWDFRLAAAETLVALGQGQAGYPIVYERFVRSMEENDVNDIFSNVLQIVTLADPRGEEIFAPLKTKFKKDANALKAIEQYEQQFKEATH